jgi:carbon-monoxide dehydrogenase medium subunit
MYPNAFEYHRATSVQEAVGILASDPEAKILAGGHSLIPAMKLRLAMPSTLVDLSQIDALRGITVDGGATIGAMTTYRELLDSDELASSFPVIRKTATVVGDPAVRNRGTLGGALAHSDPAADYTAVMLALGASVNVTGSSGDRTIAADDLFVDLFTTSMEPDEVLTSISIPAADGAGMAYHKHAHPASGYAVVGVALVLKALAAANTCSRTSPASRHRRTSYANARAAASRPRGIAARRAHDRRRAASPADGLDLQRDVHASRLPGNLSVSTPKGPVQAITEPPVS